MTSLSIRGIVQESQVLLDRIIEGAKSFQDSRNTRRHRSGIRAEFELCRKCSKIPWEQFYDPEAFEQKLKYKGYTIGSTTAVLRRSRHCVSCQFALEALSVNCESVPSGTVESPGLITYHIPEPRFLREYQALVSGETHPGRHAREYIDRIEVALERWPSTGPPSSQALNPCRLSKTFLIAEPLDNADGASQPNGISFMGRERLPEANFAMLQRWVRECEDDCSADPDHALNCTGTAIHLDEGVVLRLIDVVQSCIVEVSGTMLNPRFLAPSYVWGSAETAKLTHANLLRFLQPGALWQQSLPQTLLDAMGLVSTLGERYIWIDALCIVQDDSAEVDHVISRMNLIYQGAYLTIIAAAGDDANAGLPGLRPESRPPRPDKIPLGPLRFTNLIHDLSASNDDVTSNTRWATRSWTFQEGILSRRRLIFTAEQIYWICSKFTRCEQIHLEGTCFSRTCNRALVRRERENPFSITLPEAGIEELFAYVCQYSMTELRDPSDRLDAFKGMLSFTQSMKGGKYFAALPVSYFIVALLWSIVPDSASVVEGSEVNEQSATHPSRCFPFPSWSWLAWKGRVTWAGGYLWSLNEEYDLPKPQRVFIRPFEARKGVLVPVVDDITNQVPEDWRKRYRPHRTVLRKPPGDARVDKDPKFRFQDYDGQSNIERDRRLFFWAYIAMLDFKSQVTSSTPAAVVSSEGISLWLSPHIPSRKYDGVREFVLLAQPSGKEKFIAMEITRDQHGIAYRVLRTNGYVRPTNGAWCVWNITDTYICRNTGLT